MLKKYPITELIREILITSGLTKYYFLKELGYKNINKAFRVYDDFPFADKRYYLLVERIIDKYPTYKTAIVNALEDTQRKMKEDEFLQAAQEEREARANFKPYIYIETERKVPSPIFAAAMIGRRAKFIDFKITNQTLSDAQLVAKEHFNRNNGQSMTFGAITGYRYVDTFDSSIRLDTNGNIVEKPAGQFTAPGLASISIGNKKVSHEQLRALKLSIDPENLI